MLNKYIAIGNLTKDPELKEFGSGKKKCSFPIAINLGKETTFIDVEVWDRVAENCNKILSKGSQVFIDGKLKYNSWKTKQGYTRNKILCSADFVKAMSKAEESPLPKMTEEDIDTFLNEETDVDLEKDLEEIPF